MKILLLLFNLSAFANTQNVFLLHGYTDSAKGISWFSKQLSKNNYNIIQIEYPSFRNDISFAKDHITKMINEQLPKLEGPIHFVGHSAGGLLLRSYLQDNTVENLRHVVTMGSPARGTPYVDLLLKLKLGFTIGPFARDLSVAGSDFLRSLESPYYPLGVIAGTLEIPLTSKLIPGDDDGLVQVESTLVEGMSDFVTVKVNHVQMKYSKKIVQQVSHFLKNGSFNHDTELDIQEGSL